MPLLADMTNLSIDDIRTELAEWKRAVATCATTLELTKNLQPPPEVTTTIELLSILLL